MTHPDPRAGQVALFTSPRQFRMAAAHAIRGVEVDYPSARVDGFELGMFVSYDDCGDAWVKAPDGALAGLIWETGEPRPVQGRHRAEWGSVGTYVVRLPLP